MKVTIQHARLAFADIYTPKAFKPGDKPRCSMNGILRPTVPAERAELQKMNAAIEAVAKEKWPNEWQQMLATFKAKGDMPLLDGAVKASYDGFPGNWFVSASNTGKPMVVAKRRWTGTTPSGRSFPNPVPVVLDEAGNTYIATDVGFEKIDCGFPVKAPYAGCYVNLSLDVWAQQNQYGKRINCKLLAVQFSEDGPAFSGGEGYSDADFGDEPGTSASGDDFFGGNTPQAAASDPFGAAPAAADPFGASPAAADPFGAAPQRQAAADPFGAAKATSDPFATSNDPFAADIPF